MDPDPYWSPTSNSGSGSGKNEYGSTTLSGTLPFWIKNCNFCHPYSLGLSRSFLPFWVRIRNQTTKNKCGSMRIRIHNTTDIQVLEVVLRYRYLLKLFRCLSRGKQMKMSLFFSICSTVVAGKRIQPS